MLRELKEGTEETEPREESWSYEVSIIYILKNHNMRSQLGLRYKEDIFRTFFDQN